MKRLLILLLFIPTLSGGQVIEKIPKDGTHPYGLVVVKPSRYTVAKDYPLVIFQHGVGGRGDGSITDFGLNKLVNGELPLEIQQAAEKFDFVVIAPQTHDSWLNPETDFAFKYASEELKINYRKVYLTALSLGGGGVTRYLSANLANARKFAAVVVSCGLNWITNAKNIADAGTPVVFFHASNDGLVGVSNTDNATAAINNFNPIVKAKKVIYSSGDHYIWGRVFSPAIKPWIGNETPGTVYDWLLMNETGAPVAVPEAIPSTTLTVDAGADFSTAVNKIKLDGSKSNNWVTAGWRAISVPKNVNIWGVQGCGYIYCDNVTLPDTGTYKFELRVTDSKNAFKTDTVTVNYNNSTMPPPPPPPPAKTLHTVVYFPDGTWLKIFTDKSQEKNY